LNHLSIQKENKLYEKYISWKKWVINVKEFAVKIESKIISRYKDILTIAVLVDGELSGIFAVKDIT
jgi:hypothetical protein